MGWFFPKRSDTPVLALDLDNRGKKKKKIYEVQEWEESDNEEMAECVPWVHRGPRE